MTDLEMLCEMLKMQNALNEDIMKKKGLEEIKSDNLFHALFDELGELNHELKKDWCWWKIHVEKDNAKVLEEYVDCVHFALTYQLEFMKHWAINYAYPEEIKEDLQYSLDTITYKQKSTKDIILQILILIDAKLYNGVLWEVLALGFDLGFSMEDIYNEYLKKNKVNFERLANGY